MKALIFDIECSDMDLLIKNYGLRLNIKYLKPKQIQRDWTLFGASCMWLDEDRPKAISIHPDKPLDDYEVTKWLYDEIAKADAIIGHNSDKFDIKKLNTRAIFYGLPPLPPKIQIDTLKMARKYFAISSNSLSYLCEFLGVGFKDESPDWGKILDGDKKEIAYMRKYNKQDVIATKAVYEKLRGWHHTHPNMNHPKVRDTEGQEVEVCRVCQSPNLYVSKHRITNAGIVKVQKQCQEEGCGSYTTFERIK